MDKWKIVLILILAVVLLHILIIKIFIIGNSDDNTPVGKPVEVSQNADGMRPAVSEPPLPERPGRK